MSTKCPCGKKKSGLFLQCFNEKCEVGWWHATCCGFNKDVTKKQLESLGHWTCPCCVIDVIQIPGYKIGTTSCDDLVSKIDTQLEDLKCEIADLKAVKTELSNISKEQSEAKKLWSDIVGNKQSKNESFASTVAKEVIDRSAKAVSERESRENNIIVFNADESDSDQVSERKKHDQSIFDNVCKFINNGAIIPIKSISRVGRKITEENPSVADTSDDVESVPAVVKKIRPMKVCFSNSFDKRKFFSSLSKLKEAPVDLENIRIQHDLSPEEREKTKQLLAEAYAKNQTEEPVGFLYKVRGPPNAIRIVKVYHQ